MASKPFVLSDDFVDELRDLVSSFASEPVEPTIINMMLFAITEAAELYLEERSVVYQMNADEHWWMKRVVTLLGTPPPRFANYEPMKIASDAANYWLKHRPAVPGRPRLWALNNLSRSLAVTLDRAGLPVVESLNGLFAQMLHKILAELGEPEGDYAAAVGHGVDYLKSDVYRSIASAEI